MDSNSDSRGGDVDSDLRGMEVDSRGMDGGGVLTRAMTRTWSRCPVYTGSSGNPGLVEATWTVPTPLTKASVHTAVSPRLTMPSTNGVLFVVFLPCHAWPACFFFIFTNFSTGDRH